EIEREKFLERIQGEGVEEEIDYSDRMAPATPPPPPPQPIEMIRPTIAARQPQGKLFARLIVFLLAIAVIAGVALLAYWLLVLRNNPKNGPPNESPVVEDTNQPPVTPTPPDGPPELPQPIVVPDSPVLTDEVRTIEVESVAVMNQLKALLAEKKQAGWLTRVVIKDKTTNKVPSLQEFFQLVGASAPDQLYPLIDTDFTLLTYSFNNINHLAVEIRTTKLPESTEAMRGWEKTIEDNLSGLFILAGLEKRNSPYFTEVKYNGNAIRCQSIFQDDLRLCYSITSANNYTHIIIASSFDSVKKVITSINND
ncbi:MAG: hypothetical protein V1905_00595, partial [bacterium]